MYTQDVADEITEALEKPGGCRDQAVMCQEMATALDPENTGGVPEVQGACGLGTDSCLQDVYMPVFFNSGVNEFDIAQGRDIQFPAPYAHGFLNRESVQEKLGVDIAGGKGVNYTVHNQGFTPGESSPSVSGEVALLTGAVYAASGDYLRGDFRPQLGALLDQGVPVTLAYGDRDFTANCPYPHPPLRLFTSFQSYPEKKALTRRRVRRRGAQLEDPLRRPRRLCRRGLRGFCGGRRGGGQDAAGGAALLHTRLPVGPRRCVPSPSSLPYPCPLFCPSER